MKKKIRPQLNTGHPLCGPNIIVMLCCFGIGLVCTLGWQGLPQIAAALIGAGIVVGLGLYGKHVTKHVSALASQPTLGSLIQPADPLSEAIDDPPPLLRGLYILLIEAEEDQRDQLKSHMQEAGHWVDDTNDEQQALCLFYEHRYDLVVIGLDSADISQIRPQQLGQRFCNARRSVPLVGLTDSNDIKHIQHYLKAGFSEIMFKPVNQSRLAQTISRHAKTEESDTAVATQVRTSMNPTATEDRVVQAPTQFTGFAQAFQGNVMNANEALHNFLDQTHQQIRAIKNAMEHQDCTVLSQTSFQLGQNAEACKALPLALAAQCLEHVIQSGHLQEASLLVEDLEKQYLRLKQYIQDEGIVR